jgi:hypothetical protein
MIVPRSSLAVSVLAVPLYSLQRHAKSMFGGCHIATVDGAYAPKDADGLY